MLSSNDSHIRSAIFLARLLHQPTIVRVIIAAALQITAATLSAPSALLC